jgi:hypothetical protein
MNPCSICGSPTSLGFHPLRVSRGDRFVTVQAPHWECTTCGDLETGEPPFRSVSLAQMQEGEALVAQAWEAKYGEPIPAPKNPRSPPHLRAVY